MEGASAPPLGDALQLAEAADGILPHFLSEQRPAKSAARLAAEARTEEEKRGQAGWDKSQVGDELSDREFADMCRFMDPAGQAEPSAKRYR